MTQTNPPGWHPDPMGRHEYRYWDGSQWSDHVSDRGTTGVDPLIAGPPATEAAAAVPDDEPATDPTALPDRPVAAAVPAAAGPTPPAKVCPHCHASAATYAAICPTCGGRYAGRAKWPWVVVGLFVLMLAGLGACVAVVGTAADRVITELNREQARHAITVAQFDAVELGSSRARVISQLGRPPENIQEFLRRGVLDEAAVDSACMYYNRAGGSFGDRFQFCFENDRLISKNSY